MAPNPTLDLARELIARRSQTPDDAGCQELLKARLAPLGFARRAVQWVTNLWARRAATHGRRCV
jgi:succinyl-diaminopimelate desuccinylase